MSFVPIRELKKYRKKTGKYVQDKLVICDSQHELKSDDGIAFELKFNINLRASNAQKLLVKLRCDEVKETVCIFDLKNGELEVNRNKADGWSKGISHSILFLKEKDRNIGGIAIWEKSFDVIALGELLIDFTMNGQSEQGNNLFEACPGGAPCNVLAMLNEMGKKTAFIGKVGKDQFGKLLRKTLNDIGIDTSNLFTDSTVNTTLAFVHTFPDGDREFSFYRNPGADMMLTEDEINTTFISQAKIFHFGTLSMTQDSVRSCNQESG